MKIKKKKGHKQKFVAQDQPLPPTSCNISLFNPVKTLPTDPSNPGKKYSDVIVEFLEPVFELPSEIEDELYIRVGQGIYVWNFVYAQQRSDPETLAEANKSFALLLSRSTDKPMMMALLKRRQEQFNNFDFFVEDHSVQIVRDEISLTVSVTRLLG